ncbi:MAG: PIG-L family deacetylase [Thermomicrobiales bacterium]
MADSLIDDATLTRPEQHIFLSPHYDDIALSAGATVRRLADLGRRPETLILFGSEPDPNAPLSSFATGMHEGWGLDSREVIARRRAEEDRAAAAIGAIVRLLPFHDAIYRGHAYLSDDDLFSTPAPADQDLPERIVASLDLPAAPDATVRFYAPLGVGRHVDHQIVFTAASQLAAAGWDVWLYEDVPYALRNGARDARVAEVSTANPVALRGLVPAAGTWDAKLDGILSYPSQLETIFHHYVGIAPTRDAISDGLVAYGRSPDESHVSERFWRFV